MILNPDHLKTTKKSSVKHVVRMSKLSILICLMIYLDTGLLVAAEEPKYGNNTTIGNAADITVTGTITDTNGQPIPGVTVSLPGTTVGTATDLDGQYSINVPEGSTLVFSFIGYESQSVTVGDRSIIDVTLSEDMAALDEVVVVGYGTVKKSDLTGSVADISGESLRNMPVPSIDQKLVGQVAGVQIQQVSGAPGAGTSVKIRGSGSLGAGNEPLYVIDGMPYSSGLNQNINPLTFINPNDIEQITILKDASSTAIYGSRGANGVIMITTKNAGKNVNQINYSGYAGFQSVPRRGRPEMLNAREFAEYQRDRIDFAVRTRENREPSLADYPEEYRDLAALEGKGTNWYDLILQNAFVQDHNISIQNGNEKSQVFLGFGYYQQEGVIKHTGLKRYSANFSYNLKVSDRINISASLKPAFIDQDRIISGTGRNNVTGVALWANPVVDAYDEDGNLIPFLHTPASIYNTTWSFANPLFTLKESKRNYKELRNLGAAHIEWEPIADLKIR